MSIQYTKILNNWGESNDSMCKKIDENGGWPEWATDLMFYHTVESDNRPTIWAQNWTITKDDGTIHYLDDGWWTVIVSLKQYKAYKKKEWIKNNSSTMDTVREAISLLYQSIKTAEEFNDENPGGYFQEAARLSKMATEKLKTASVMTYCKKEGN